MSFFTERTTWYLLIHYSIQMQAAGSPPPDLVGDMNAAQEALQDMDQGCPTQ